MQEGAALADEPAADVESLHVVPKRDEVEEPERVNLCVRQVAFFVTEYLLSSN